MGGSFPYGHSPKQAISFQTAPGNDIVTVAILRARPFSRPLVTALFGGVPPVMKGISDSESMSESVLFAPMISKIVAVRSRVETGLSTTSPLLMPGPLHANGTLTEPCQGDILPQA